MQQRITIENAEVWIEGAGDDVILMLHGWPDTLHLWDEQVQFFAPRYRCVRFNLPGFDPRDSGKVASHAQISQHIAAVLDAVSPGRQAILMLHDWGAVFGYQFYMQNPHRVSHIIGVDVGNIQGDTFAKNLSLHEKALVFGYQSYLALAWTIGSRIHGGLGTAMTRGMARLLRCPSPSQEIHWGMCYPYFVRWFKGFDHYDNLIAIHPRCPMLYVYALQKPVMFHTEAWLAMLRKQPGSRVEAMPTSHWVMTDAPKAFNTLVHTWLEQAPRLAPAPIDEHRT
jgi:cis-3-alkyl-4-acyloxetan-2-one decarboxylase